MGWGRLCEGTIYDFQRKNELRFEIFGDYDFILPDERYEEPPFSIFFAFRWTL